MYPIRFLFISYSPHPASCSARAFPCLISAFSYTLLPSILHIFCLLAQVFRFFLNLFFFPLFLSPPSFCIHTEHTCDGTDRRRAIIANHRTHEPLQVSLSKEIPLKLRSSLTLPSRPSTYFLLFFFCRCLFFTTLFSHFSRFFLYSIQNTTNTT